MTLPKTMSLCPVCGKLYAALSNHLRSRHNVSNAAERVILLKMGTGRIEIRHEPCPVPGCLYESSRLDKHLEHGHNELTEARRKTHLAKAKRKKALRLLAALRASNPKVPLVTRLDIRMVKQEVDDEVFPGAMPGGDEEEEEKEPKERCPQCRAAKAEEADLKIRVDDLTKELASVRRRVRLLARRLRRMQPEAEAMEESSGMEDAPEEKPDDLDALKKE